MALAGVLLRAHAAYPQVCHVPRAQGAEKRGRTPFGRIREWLDIAEQFVFEDPEVGAACKQPPSAVGACWRLSR